jgi:hypothetical protein
MTPGKWAFLIAGDIITLFIMVKVPGRLGEMLKKYKWESIILGDVLSICILSRLPPRVRL